MAKKADIKEVRETLRAHLDRTRADYPANASVQIRVPPEHAAALFSEPHPEEFSEMKKALSRKEKPSHFLFTPEQLETLLNHGAEKEPDESEAGNQAADVRRQRKS